MELQKSKHGHQRVCGPQTEKYWFNWCVTQLISVQLIFLNQWQHFDKLIDDVNMVHSPSFYYIFLMFSVFSSHPFMQQWLFELSSSCAVVSYLCHCFLWLIKRYIYLKWKFSWAFKNHHPVVYWKGFLGIYKKHSLTYVSYSSCNL